MTITKNLQLQGVQPVMLFLHGVVVEEFAKIDKPWFLTSGLRRGGKKSLHTRGFALDYRSRHLTPQEKATITRNVAKRTAGHFDFIFEPTVRRLGRVVKTEHFHGEYDPK